MRAGIDAIYRTSPFYRLVVFDRLKAEEQASLRHLQPNADFYGVLRPTVEDGGTIKVVGKETALLLFTLREPGSLPAFALQGKSAPDRLAEISAFVLDGVLEVHDGSGFVSGPKAVPLLSTSAGTDVGVGALPRLSRDALRYAEALGLDDIESLARRLYAFHHFPVTACWQRTLGDVRAIRKRLGVDSGGARRRRLIAWAKEVKRRSATDWLGWTRRGRDGSNLESALTYKLYISPAVEALVPVFETLVCVLPHSRAYAFKIGGSAADLLRPDKLVVYFEDFGCLSRTAAELGEKFVGIPAQGVPFTAEISGEGLLSWGLDPPRKDRIVPWRARESWRLWITRRLAAALIAARKRAHDGTPPWRFALERLRLRGVDVDRWIPRPTLFRGEA